MNMTFGWPQFIYGVLFTAGVITSFVKHGQPAEINSGWSKLIAFVAILILYWCGGFYDTFSFPQVFVTGILLFGLLRDSLGVPEGNHNFFKSLFWSSLYLGMLVWGGFFG